jgi:hypothetical protein
MTPAQKDFLNRAYEAAQQAGHIFPEMAACECALESGCGTSVRQGNYFQQSIWESSIDRCSFRSARRW